MSTDLLLVVGAERFLAWVVLFVISFVTYNMARRMEDPYFYVPIFGMSVESFSWGVHQFNWWVHHVALMAGYPTRPDLYNIHLVVAALAYVGVAIGGSMILYIILNTRFGDRWWIFAGGFMIAVWLVGYAVGLMWIKQA